MPPISKQKREKISEQILHHLFASFPESRFTSQISQETARDEEFIKSILTELESKKLITKITKNKNGLDYKKRQRWTISPDTYTAYKKILAQSQPNTYLSL